MKVDSTQKLLEIQLMSQIIKSSGSSDNESFQMMLSTLMNAYSNSEMDLSSLSSSDTEALSQISNRINTEVSSGNISIDEAVKNAATKYNVDEKLIMAVIKQESNFNATSVSSAGAQGLMQLMPSTARELGVKNSFDIQQNIDGGTKYLKKMLDNYGNSKEMALAAYNAGSGTVKNRGMKSASEVYKMPSETQNYVKKVMENYNE